MLTTAKKIHVKKKHNVNTLSNCFYICSMSKRCWLRLFIYHFFIYCMNIYVGNLNYKVTENSLKEVFAEFGEVSSAKIITDKVSGRSKGFGFIEMPNDAEAQSAIDGLNEKEHMGRKLVVNKARAKE